MKYIYGVYGSERGVLMKTVYLTSSIILSSVSLVSAGQAPGIAERVKFFENEMSRVSGVQKLPLYTEFTDTKSFNKAVQNFEEFSSEEPAEKAQAFPVVSSLPNPQESQSWGSWAWGCVQATHNTIRWSLGLNEEAPETEAISAQVSSNSTLKNPSQGQEQGSWMKWIYDTFWERKPAEPSSLDTNEIRSLDTVKLPNVMAQVLREGLGKQDSSVLEALSSLAEEKYRREPLNLKQALRKAEFLQEMDLYGQEVLQTLPSESRKRSRQEEATERNIRREEDSRPSVLSETGIEKNGISSFISKAARWFSIF